MTYILRNLSGQGWAPRDVVWFGGVAVEETAPTPSVFHGSLLAENFQPCRRDQSQWWADFLFFIPRESTLLT